MYNIPTTDIRITKGELLPPPPLPAKVKHSKLTAQQWGALSLWALVAACIIPVLIAMFWAFGILIGVVIILVCIGRT
jgi:hypothetical protein